MEFGMYENSYLKRFDAINKYNKASSIKEKNVLKPKPIIDFISDQKISNKFIDKDKVQEHKNYINKKTTQEIIIKSEYEFKHNNKYKYTSNENYNIKKEGYMSRENKEPVLNNRSNFGYETIRKNDLVSISRPIYWPERGYSEKIDNNDYFKTCY